MNCHNIFAASVGILVGIIICTFITVTTCQTWPPFVEPVVPDSPTLDERLHLKAIERNYSFRLQPEFDILNVDFYLYNDRLFNFQLKCVLYDKPCDVVGQWMVPRIPKLLMGECLKCTPIQKQRMMRVREYIKNKKPEVYKALWDKYIVYVITAITPKVPDESSRVENTNYNTNTNELKDYNYSDNNNTSIVSSVRNKMEGSNIEDFTTEKYGDLDS